ncbi:recombination regulator RecX [Aggregatibacter actinomycetemcomitans]|uniref:recombination regulator RecX n=1 Tax=Aggregatibacter actinomycetemcomitans TaxID=714 RepID=UPI0011D82E07|nr:recombination regulator RecX [Aggregatibacter actinomycetemcomitans]QEH44418.1 recombination regulator RecX [Aggregatibacter actinomycetemcomitans]QEH46962.1 recombination regulator RecX [Aggregatibacter actinomycetemcomitans]TYA48659.1 recombination regulator RecX [Aggregatibacter actinomycetemcomitans]TYA50307.1 recombination regulator RecX [Aggregatibacter actinomycetemcomitans]TYB28793.1 recombination regulator RecX [Aggregatibacter actinomycetemcomitans]
MSSLALNYVMNLLSRREYSEFELRCKMQEKAFSEDDIDQAIAHCQQKNWQSDARFTESYLHSRAQRGYGANQIKQELRQLKGVENTTIEAVMRECEIDWSALALTVLRKKFPDYKAKQPPKIRQKIWQYMLSHGFHGDDFSDYVGSEPDEFD